MKPRKKRDVLYPPGIRYFKPQGVSTNNLNNVYVTVDEYEAIRLADHEKLNHEKAAKLMNISRPTFTRLIESAHNKIGDALVNGKAVRIEGGDFNFLGNRLRCRRCGFYWNINKKKNSILSCQNCGSIDIEDIGKNMTKNSMKGKRSRFGRGWNK